MTATGKVNCAFPVMPSSCSALLIDVCTHRLMLFPNVLVSVKYYLNVRIQQQAFLSLDVKPKGNNRPLDESKVGPWSKGSAVKAKRHDIINIVNQ